MLEMLFYLSCCSNETGECEGVFSRVHTNQDTLGIGEAYVCILERWIHLQCVNICLECSSGLSGFRYQSISLFLGLRSAETKRNISQTTFSISCNSI